MSERISVATAVTEAIVHSLIAVSRRQRVTPGICYLQQVGDLKQEVITALLTTERNGISGNRVLLVDLVPTTATLPVPERIPIDLGLIVS